MGKPSPSPFLRGNQWWARVPQIDADAIQRPLGVAGEDNRDVALEVCRFLAWCKGRREIFLLSAMATGRCTVGAAYSAYVDNRMDRFVAELRDGIQDTDIEPYVARWQKELTRKKKPNADSRAKYLRQVRTLLVEGQVFRKSAFTKQAIRTWLSELPVGQPNRYRAALSSFAEFLVFEDVLAGNPVLQVPAGAERDPRAEHLSQVDAKKLIRAMATEPKQQAFHAAMLATAMEFGAAKAIDPATCTETSAYAAGTKREHRKRTCTINDRWRWAWKVAHAYLQQFPDGSQPFGDVTHYQSDAALKRGLKKAGITREYTQHDHRHTWAVQGIRDGLALHVIAHQLGHRDSVMTLRVYGRFAVNAADYRPATMSATVVDDHELEPEASE